MSETMRFKNTSDNVVKLAAIGLPDVPPKGEIDVPLDLCAPGRTDSGNRAKSAIECVAPQMLPVSDTDLEAWRATPPPTKPVSKVVSITGRQPDEPPGVRALRAQREALEAQKKASAPKADAHPKTETKTSK